MIRRLAIACVAAMLAAPALAASFAERLNIPGGQPIMLDRALVTGEGGAPVSLGQFQGRIALISIWATWCGACKFDMPQLDALAGELGPEGLAVIPLSIDADPRKVARHYRNEGFEHLPQYFDSNGDVARLFFSNGGLVGTPIDLVIDHTGRLVAFMIGAGVGDSRWDGPEAKAWLRGLMADARAAQG